MTLLHGLPPTVAVVSNDLSDLYVARGSLVQSEAHPLHSVVYGQEPLRYHHCRRSSRVAAVVDDGLFPGIETADGHRPVAVDGRTRITNRAAYEPLSPGQRLRVATAPRRVARGG